MKMKHAMNSFVFRRLSLQIKKKVFLRRVCPEAVACTSINLFDLLRTSERVLKA